MIVVMGAFCVLGCSGPAQETRQETAEPATNEGGEAKAIPPEKFEEIDHFFRGKGADLQFACYNPAVEKHGKKFEGAVTVSLMVEPGGKAGDAKILNSTLHAPDIEQCVLKEIGTWDWPDVPTAAPYTGTVNFKPAW
jgi:hypothetical protein